MEAHDFNFLDYNRLFTDKFNFILNFVYRTKMVLLRDKNQIANTFNTRYKMGECEPNGKGHLVRERRETC